MRTLHKIITALIIALGVLHVCVTFVDYDEFNLRALWFAGAGVAIILAGFLNVALLRDASKDKVILLLCFLTNLIFVVMFAAALYLMQQPQVILGVVLFFAACVNTVFAHRIRPENAPFRELKKE